MDNIHKYVYIQMDARIIYKMFLCIDMSMAEDE